MNNSPSCCEQTNFGRLSLGIFTKKTDSSPFAKPRLCANKRSCYVCICATRNVRLGQRKASSSPLPSSGREELLLNRLRENLPHEKRCCRGKKTSSNKNKKEIPQRRKAMFWMISKKNVHGTDYMKFTNWRGKAIETTWGKNFCGHGKTLVDMGKKRNRERTWSVWMSLHGKRKCAEELCG